MTKLDDLRRLRDALAHATQGWKPGDHPAKQGITGDIEGWSLGNQFGADPDRDDRSELVLTIERAGHVPGLRPTGQDRRLDVNLCDLISLALMARIDDVRAIPNPGTQAIDHTLKGDLLSLPQQAVTEAESLRNDGMRRVAERNPAWTSRAQEMLTAVRGFEGTGEDLRLLLKEQGLPEPHHPNAWGSLIGWGRRKGHLSGTGAIAKTKDPKNKATRREVLRSQA